MNEPAVALYKKGFKTRIKNNLNLNLVYEKKLDLSLIRVNIKLR